MSTSSAPKIPFPAFAGVIFLISASVCCFGQQSTCTVPVYLSTPDFSQVSKTEAEALIKEWNQNIQSKKYELANSRWDWKSQSDDYYKAVHPRPLGYQPIRYGPPWRLLGADDSLAAPAFMAFDKEGPVRVDFAGVDRGPRRIVIVAENGNQMTQAAREIEAALIAELLSKSGSDDRFALLGAGGVRVALGFDTPKETIQKKFEQLLNVPSTSSKPTGMRDAVLEAMHWLQPAQRGDCIFVITMHLEGKHTIKFSKLLREVVTSQVRVFGVQLGWLVPPRTVISSITCSDGFNGCIDSGPSDLRDELSRLSQASGGWAVADDTEPGWHMIPEGDRLIGVEEKQYKVTEARLGRLKDMVGTMYKHITQCYFLNLTRTGPGVVIRPSPAVFTGFPWLTISYPSLLPKCSSASSPPPSAPLRSSAAN
ncbi:MAG TPA: hypothetical protein VFM21_08565 [Terriglobia bacterium]|nr:hypothetical protein [Terriglobia bacterium]